MVCCAVVFLNNVTYADKIIPNNTHATTTVTAKTIIRCPLILIWRLGNRYISLSGWSLYCHSLKKRSVQEIKWRYLINVSLFNCHTSLTIYHEPKQGFFVALLTVTSWWARWRPKSPASLLFAQPFVQAQTRKHQSSTSLASTRESTGDRWIPLITGR